MELEPSDLGTLTTDPGDVYFLDLGVLLLLLAGSEYLNPILSIHASMLKNSTSQVRLNASGEAF